MPDNDFLTRSLFFNQAQQDTPSGQLGQGMSGVDPQQLMQMLQHPAIQQMLQQHGIDFDPSKIRQSPFLPNSFMGAHPGIGGAISGGLANVAATPKADLVQGFGTGFTNAAQGMMGGPEMQRQYQVNQMMAPFKMLGQQMPVAGEERRQQLLQALMGDINSRRGQQETELEQKSRGLDLREQGLQNRSMLDEATARYRDAQAQLSTAKSAQEQQNAQTKLLTAQADMVKAQAAQTKAAGAQKDIRPQLQKLEVEKQKAYDQLQKDYAPYLSGQNTPPPKGYTPEQWGNVQAQKTAEFNQRKQQIEDNYTRGHANLGNPINQPYQYPGQKMAPDLQAGGNLLSPGGGGAQQPQQGGGAQQQQAQPPQGATGQAMGSDGKMHWTDGKQDLGPAE